ncbi:hypothetical protein [Mycolicibacterium tusciae]|jgi:hypothetical protein|uniref:Uncharacterized protein n=1 Tax=Mycolicibacterium tusciae TaxID=75922 RepID=A0A1X0JM39_9MYCO|nr:hypothetical protein [Mycolicibacterium tusciae]ORB63901.1 hypothetical protein BST47_17870 [Mycolicibacterium tusciae]
MVQAVESQQATSHSIDLLDDVRDAAKVGQHAAAEALRAFRQTVDEAVPQAVEPLRTKIVDAAVELADKLVAAQFQLNRDLIHSAERALTKSDGDKK